MNIGDKVAHKDKDLEGIIVNIDGDLVTFQSQEGFEYSYNQNDLVLIDGLLDKTLVNQKINPKITSNKNIKKLPVRIPEFDLHIEKIQPKYKHLSPDMILEIQLNEAQRILQKMKKSHHKEIVFIHGLGKQVLKKELIRILKQKGFQYYDASFQKYGSGAVRVILR